MKFGFFGINTGPCAAPDTAKRVAQAAESLGFESLWTGEHVVLPDPQVPPSPVPAHTPFLDPAVSLAFVAAHTSKILLGTGIIILPQRNPLVLAKELASVDVVSKGRLIFGLGVGYLEPEFRALGIPFDDKGGRAEDYLAAMLAVWTQAKPSHQGRYVSFSGIQAQPQPQQKPHPPIVIGGHTPPAFRRAVQHGNGWYGFAMDVEGATLAIAGIRQAQSRYERPPELGPLEVSVTPRGKLDADTIKRFADAGVQRIIIYRPRGNEDEILRDLGDWAENLLAVK